MKTRAPHLPALLTVDQAAEQLGISRARCYQLITGEYGQPPKIRSVTVGRLRRVASADLLAYIESLKAEADASASASAS